MARKRTASSDTLMPDPVYGSKLASKFVNCLMWQGKKATAQRIFYGAMDQIKKRMPDVEPIDVFVQAVEHVKPTVEVRSKRVGGATYQVPMQVNRTRQQSLAIRWLIGAARSKAVRPWPLLRGGAAQARLGGRRYDRDRLRPGRAGTRHHHLQRVRAVPGARLHCQADRRARPRRFQRGGRAVAARPRRLCRRLRRP